MTSMERQLDGPVLVHHLRKDQQTIEHELVQAHGHSARTLVKEGPLRLTLIAVAPGAGIPVHKAEGPVSIQLIEGDASIEADGTSYRLVVGDVIVLAAGVEHAVGSKEGCVLLLTIAFTGGRAERADAG